MGSASPEKRPVDANVWFGLGIFGIVVIAIGIWSPLYAFVPVSYRWVVQTAIVFAGFSCSFWGFPAGYEAYQQERSGTKPRPLRGHAREIAIAPSFEVYDPRQAMAHERPDEPTEPPTEPEP